MDRRPAGRIAKKSDVFRLKSIHFDFILSYFVVKYAFHISIVGAVLFVCSFDFWANYVAN